MSEADSPATPGVIDLNVRMTQLGFSYEPPEQMRQRNEREFLQLKHQLEQEALDKQHRRSFELGESKHRRLIFWAIFGVIIAVGIVSTWISLFGSATSPETQAWARTTASAIVGGIVGYFTGAGLSPR